LEKEPEKDDENELSLLTPNAFEVIHNFNSLKPCHTDVLPAGY
jgi:hypothetical protein